MALLVDARGLAAESVRKLDLRRGTTDDLRQLPRSFRITTRLGEIVAWIMARRAVHAGELSEIEARSEKYRLGSIETCLADDDAAYDLASPRLRRLSDRSLSLYRRVARLDSLIDEDLPMALPAGRTV